MLQNGGIAESGTYDELVEKKGDFADFLATYLKEDGNDENGEAGQWRSSCCELFTQAYACVSCTKLIVDVEKKEDTPSRENVVRQRSRSSSESVSVRSMNR